MPLIAVALLVLASCTFPSQPLTVQQTSPLPETTTEASEVVLGLGYIPSVQFAPFYVALDRGYFTEQGLDVTLQHGLETDFLKLVASDQMQFAVGSGEQVILGQAQELPLVYAAAWYQKFPVTVFALRERGLAEPGALEGQRVGIPGLFGASLVAWKALVYATGIDETQVTLESIGFTQAAAVSEGRVDAAIDYIVNGPVQLQENDREVDVIAVSDYIDLPANGLITNEKTVAERPELVQRMTTALLKGIQYTLDNPDEAFAVSIAAVPEAGGDNEAINRAIFDASLDLWQVPPDRLGYSDPQAWEQAAAFMLEMGLIDTAVNPEEVYTNEFATGATLE
jgi:NitT/TauT family transport system substrate-binding protein